MISELLGELPDAVMLADPLSEGCPIVWTSQGFCTLTGYSDEMIGTSWDCLLEGVPEHYVSRSAQQNIQDYVRACQLPGLSRMAEVASVQPNKRKDGSTFVNFLLLGHCHVRDHQCIVGVPLSLGEGAWVKVTRTQTAQALEDARAVFKRMRAVFRRCRLDGPVRQPARSWSGLSRCDKGASQPRFGFFAERLQDHCVLLDGGFTAVRREAETIPRGCMLFGNRPVRRRPGLGLVFDVRVDGVSRSFSGLPVLGFTRRRPEDRADLYPSVSKCLGASALIGGLGAASVRDKEAHFQIGFKPPPASEVLESSTLLSEGCFHPPALCDGDVLRCTLADDGRLELVKNGELALAFDTGRPLEVEAEYYAVVDVCLAARAVTLMAGAGDLETDSVASTATPRGLLDPSTADSVMLWTSETPSGEAIEPDSPRLAEGPPRSRLPKCMEPTTFPPRH